MLRREALAECVATGQRTTYALADVVPTVTRGAAPACPPGWTVMMNGGDEPENVSWIYSAVGCVVSGVDRLREGSGHTGRHSWTPEGVLIAGSGAPPAATDAVVDCAMALATVARATKTLVSIILERERDGEVVERTRSKS